MSAFSRRVSPLFLMSLCGVAGAHFVPGAQAQNARFILRAEPDVIAANGISTTSIFVQVPDSGGAIAATPIVRFVTTAGTIESQSSLSGGVARVLLRSAATPGTAVVTAFIGNSREVITVEFSAENERVDRYLEVTAPYVAYGQSVGVITSSGKSAFDFGDIHIESDVRLDVDLYAERVWAEGNKNGVSVRQGRGARAKTLTGDRLFLDLKRRSGVMRRAEGDGLGGDKSARQEFFGSDFAALPPLDPTAPTPKITPVVNGNAAAQFAAPAATEPVSGNFLGDGIDNNASQNVLDNRQAQAQALAQSGAVSAKIAEETPKTQTNTTDPAAVAADNVEVQTPDEAVENTQLAPTANAQTGKGTTENASAPNAPILNSPAANANPINTSAIDAPSANIANVPAANVINANIASALAVDADTVNSRATENRRPEIAPSANAAAATKNAASAPTKNMRLTMPAMAPLEIVPFEIAGNQSAVMADAPANNTREIAPVDAPRAESPERKLDAANSNAPGETRTQSNPLVTQPRPDADGIPSALARPAPYKPLPDSDIEPRIIELPPPAYDVSAGYWVAARRLRVFPRDEIQFERAAVYYNGGKAFKVPLYVLPLDGSFNPTTDIFAFNSSGGLSVKFPIFYQASKGGTGALIVRNDPGAGFSAGRQGPSLELDQQYTLSPGSRGRLGIDQIGNGAPNFNFQHQQSLGNSSAASFFLNVPRGRDIFGRAAIAKDFNALQVGLEAFYDGPQNRESTTRGQFYARMRPRDLGKTGFSYTVSANLLAISRFGTTRFVPGTGGGVAIPGQGNGDQFVTDFDPLFGQTLTGALQAPLFRPWSGAQFTGNLLTTAFNYSNGSRGVAPGITLGYSQTLGNRANLRLDYTYDRSAIGLYGTGGNFTNYISAALDARITNKIGFSTFLSQSLTDQSLYGNSDLTYRISSKWRAGLFADYSKFGFDNTFNYGWTVGRAIGPRELTINYDALRDRIYFQIGTARY